MATFRTVTGTVLLPVDGTVPQQGVLRFTLTGFDTEGADLIAGTVFDTPVDANTGAVSVDLWTPDEGEAGLSYTVVLQHYVPALRRRDEVHLGVVTLTAGVGSVDLTALLSVPPPAPVTADVLALALAAAASAQADAADAAASAAAADGAEAAQIAAEAARDVAILARDAALLSRGVFASTAAGISNGVAAVTVTGAGTGGSNGVFALAFSGGGGTGAAGTFTVSGGAIVSVTITNPGTGYTSAPTVSFAASSGLSGATATVAIAARTPVGGYFSVPASGDDSLILYRVDAGPVATELVRFPSSSIVQNIGLLTGFYDETALSTTYGATSFDVASFTTAAIYASDAVTDITSRLLSVSVRVSSGGTGRFIVYSANGDDTYENIGVYPASFAAAGVYSFAAGGGVIPAGVILPAGSFIAYERISSSRVRGQSGAGTYYTVTGDAGLGSTVTRTLGGSSAISLAFTTEAFAETIGERADAAVAGAENALSRIGQPAGSGQTAAQTVGDASGNTATFNAGTYASPDLVTADGPLKSVSVRVNGAGDFELHHMRRLSATTWECIAVWAAVVGAGGLHEFVAGESVIPLGVSMEEGDFIAMKTGTARLQYGGVTGATWALINNATGLGAIVTRTINTNNFRASIAFIVGSPARTLESRLFELEDRLAYLTTPVALTSAYALGDSTVAAFAGGTAIMGLINSARTEVDLSVPGHTIAQQQTAWLNLTISRLSVGWVIAQIGLNDLNPAEAASVAISRLQGLINIIRAEIGPYRPLFVSQMIPCRQRLINLYGATNGPIAYQKWLDMNAAIAGTGPTPITNVDGRITAHVALMNDGAGNLLGAYDTGDGIHPNTAGRQVNATAWTNALTAAGLVV